MIKRGSTAYCAKCALARDWEEIVMVVQEDRVDSEPTVSFDELAEEEALANVEAETNKDSEAEQKAEPKQEAEPEQKAEPKQKAAVTADADSNGSSELPADPFG